MMTGVTIRSGSPPTGYAAYDYYQSDDRTRRTLPKICGLSAIRHGRCSVGSTGCSVCMRWRMSESDRQVFSWDAYDAAADGGPGLAAAA